MYTFKTKFQPNDKVKWNDGKTNNKVGKIEEVHILYPSGDDMDYWEKTLPKLENGNYQFTSYTVNFGNNETHDIEESGITLVV